MAAPPNRDIRNLNGEWVLNKSLSDDVDALLKLQGISWLLRKGIGLATVTLSITQYDADVEGTSACHVDIEQTLTGGIPGTTEKRVLNWVDRAHSDNIFGAVKGKSRYVGTKELVDANEDAFLSDGWLEETTSTGLIQSYVESDNDGWIANQTWGFEEVKGERRYTRHVIIKKGEEVVKARLVYDFLNE